MTQAKSDLALFQFNPGFYNNQSYLPYAVGMLWAYAKSFPDLDAAYRNAGFRFVRDSPEQIIASFENVDVAAFSTYLWNWEISNAVARGLKQRFPHVTVIFGGPNIPNDARELLRDYPHIDIAVHGEGEKTIADILRARLAGGDYSDIPGLSTTGADGEFICKQQVRDPIMQLDELPSPYLTGVFDELFENTTMRYQAIWETNRGCPYKCTFCYWGSDYAFAQKLRQFEMDRLYKEIDWFADHEINHIYLADANFGIIPRDVEIAQRLAATKAARNGFPTKFKANFAKNSTERVVEIARILNREKLDRGISLATQSMDETVLTNVKRRNLRIESFANFMHKYQQEDIPAYVELILGLPGETYESFRDGITKLLVAGAHDALFLHKCVLLPNTEMSAPEYVAEHGIQTRHLPATLSHSTTRPEDVQEYEDLIIQTNSMPHPEWKRSYLLAWAVQTCHILRLTQVPAQYAWVFHNVGYGEFYEALIDFARRNPETVIGRELIVTEHQMEEALDGGHFERILPEFSTMYWPPEEASFLQICLEMDRFHDEFLRFMREMAEARGWAIDATLLEDLETYQKAVTVKWDVDGTQTLELGHSVHSFYRNQLEGKGDSLKKGRFRIAIEDNLKYCGDKERFSREIPFWGRRGGSMTYKKVSEEALEIEAELAPAV